MAWYGFAPTWRTALLPAFVALAMLASLGPSLPDHRAHRQVRDFRYIIPFIVQFGFYISPVGFSSAVVPEGWRQWYNRTRWSESSTPFASACWAATAA